MVRAPVMVEAATILTRGFRDAGLLLRRVAEFFEMSEKAGTNENERPRPPEPAGEAAETGAPVRPKEIAGRDGPDPVRYGDWEKNGRCIDF